MAEVSTFYASADVPTKLLRSGVGELVKEKGAMCRAYEKGLRDHHHHCLHYEGGSGESRRCRVPEHIQVGGENQALFKIWAKGSGHL